MSDARQIRRHLAGLIGLSMLIAGAVGLLLGSASGQTGFSYGVLLKVGIVLILLWLAYPQLQRFPSWVAAAIFIVGCALAIRPRVVAVLVRAALPLLAILPLLWLLRPRPSARRRTR